MKTFYSYFIITPSGRRTTGIFCYALNRKSFFYKRILGFRPYEYKYGEKNLNMIKFWVQYIEPLHYLFFCEQIKGNFASCSKTVKKYHSLTVSIPKSNWSYLNIFIYTLISFLIAICNEKFGRLGGYIF